MAPQHDPLYREAIERLQSVFEEAHQRGLMEPYAASLATADLRGRPSIRTVSVVDIDDQGPVFLIDSRSGKGRQLEDNPCAALCFLWPELAQQVVIEGHAEPACAQTADRCWARRPREGQLAAWVPEEEFRRSATEGGDPLTSVRRRFASSNVPRPPHWQALHLHPDMLLFWKLGWRHIHARERYGRDAAGRWRIERMRPF